MTFHGGISGPVLLIGLFLGAVIWITSLGLTSIQAYLAPLCLILGLAIFLTTDRHKACDAILAGVADRTLATMLLAFLGAGAFGQLLVASGLIDGIVSAGYAAGVGKDVIVVLSFLVAAVIATAIGTSTGTCVTVVPVLYPAGVLLGAHPALLLGAIYSGARFGDNIAPISDTTVASAYTQEVEVGEVVSSRLKYALVAGGISALLYFVAALIMKTTGDSGTGEFRSQGSLTPLWMLLAPALTVVLCLRGRSLIEALWAGIFLAIVVGLGTGTLALQEIYYAEAPKSVGGALTDGITSMRDVVFLAILVMAIIGLLRQSGILDRLVRSMIRFAATRKRAELSIFLLVSFLCPLCAGNTPAMLFSGPVVSQIGKRHDIHPARRANLMDLAGNGVTENLPHINTMLALAGVMLIAHETTGAPLVSVAQIGLLAFHPMALTAIGLFAIATGWGSRRG